MAIQKSTGSKKGAKGKNAKKRLVDPFVKKDWYLIKAPNFFSNSYVGRTPVTRTQGTKLASDGLRHRVVEVNLAELQKDEDQAYRKIKLQVQEIQGNTLLTNFYGLSFTTDKLRSLVRKWQSLIEANVDVKTADGYTLRVFAIGFTNRRANQKRETTYAQTSQERQIRKRMTDIIKREVQTTSLKDLVVKFIPNSIGRQIERETQGIFPLKDCHIRKVKMIKAPRFDAQKLSELYVGSSIPTFEEVGKPVVVATPAAEAPADLAAAPSTPTL
jgi:small subunit ribosomal protein S3Ae